MKSILTFFFCFILFFSCKKDRLVAEKSLLIGAWDWVYTRNNYGWCEGNDFSQILTPTSEASSYKVEIEEKGIIKFYKNNKLLDKKRIVFDTYSPSDTYDYWFFINLNNNEEDKLRGGIKSDSLILANFPFSPKIGCEVQTSYFLKP
jgi:hypothetical protein